MARVFVSHASADEPLAKEVGGWLGEVRQEYFLDSDLRAGILLGDEWERRLHERLRWADVVICLVTESYVSSAWCSAEAGIARARGSRVLPINVEPGVAHPLLLSVQHLDMTLGRDHVKQALVNFLHRADLGGPSGWADDRNPYPGLQPFEIEESRVFFGRSRETERLSELLRSPAEQAKDGLLVVVGPSGCGKSSLVRAGVASAMADEDHWLVLPPMKPGTTPLAELARVLAEGLARFGASTTVADVDRHLHEGGVVSVLDELRVAARRLDVRRILLIVDQLEELITHADHGESARFLATLAPGIRGCLSVLGTLRPDFLDALLGGQDPLGLPLQRIFALHPLDREGIYSIIEGPAEVAGLKIDRQLTRRLVEDGGSGDALPLIAYTLSRLADGLHRGDELSMRGYEHLGGVQSAIQKRADMALEAAVSASGRLGEQVVRGLLRLVAVDQEGAPTRMQLMVDQLPDSERTEYAAFVAERLLTIDALDHKSRVSVAHEAIFSAWPPLAQEIDKARVELKLRAAVESSARDWQVNGQHSSLLLTGPRLTESYELWGPTGSPTVNISDRARIFLQQSYTSHSSNERRERLNKRLLKQTLTAGLFFAFVCLAIFLVTRALIMAQLDESLLNRATQAAKSELTDPQQLASTSPAALLAGDIRVALLYENGLAKSSRGAATAPPLGDDEMKVAKASSPSSTRTAADFEKTYRVVAVPAGDGRALVICQDLQPVTRLIVVLGATLAVPALIGIALAAASAAVLTVGRQSRPA